jgi:hypothetical protein
VAHANRRYDMRTPLTSSGRTAGLRCSLGSMHRTRRNRRTTAPDAVRRPQTCERRESRPSPA